MMHVIFTTTQKCQIVLLVLYVWLYFLFFFFCFMVHLIQINFLGMTSGRGFFRPWLDPTDSDADKPRSSSPRAASPSHTPSKCAPSPLCVSLCSTTPDRDHPTQTKTTPKSACRWKNCATTPQGQDSKPPDYSILEEWFETWFKQQTKPSAPEHAEIKELANKCGLNFHQTRKWITNKRRERRKRRREPEPDDIDYEATPKKQVLSQAKSPFVKILPKKGTPHEESTAVPLTTQQVPTYFLPFMYPSLSPPVGYPFVSGLPIYTTEHPQLGAQQFNVPSTSGPASFPQLQVAYATFADQGLSRWVFFSQNFFGSVLLFHACFCDIFLIWHHCVQVWILICCYSEFSTFHSVRTLANDCEP